MNIISISESDTLVEILWDRLIFYNFLYKSFSLIMMVNIDWISILISSTSLFESLIIKSRTSISCDSHISWLVSEILMTEFSGTLFHIPLMERLWLIELFSVLSSILISVSILLCCPACAIPKSRVHHISRTIILYWLPWSI